MYISRKLEDQLYDPKHQVPNSLTHSAFKGKFTLDTVLFFSLVSAIILHTINKTLFGIDRVKGCLPSALSFFPCQPRDIIHFQIPQFTVYDFFCENTPIDITYLSSVAPSCGNLLGIVHIILFFTYHTKSRLYKLL